MTEKEITSKEKEESFRRILKGLVIGELVVIILSSEAAHYTYQNYGSTPAYFSTWTRCQDFAFGGLTFLLLRLSPLYPYYISDSIPRSPFLSALLEVGTFLCLFIMTAPVFVALPVDRLMVWYINGVETFLAAGISVTMVASCLHGTRPPKWAIFSRFLRHPLLVYIGATSYSLYLWHWPLIVWFGNPYRQLEVMSHSAFANLVDHSEDAKSPLGLADALIMCATFIMASLSFHFIELPVLHLRLTWSKKKIFVTSAIAVSVTLLLIFAVTYPQNSLEELAYPSENLPTSSFDDPNTIDAACISENSDENDFAAALPNITSYVSYICNSTIQNAIKTTMLQRDFIMRKAIETNRAFRNTISLQIFSDRTRNTVVSFGVRLSGFLTADTKTKITMTDNDSGCGQRSVFHVTLEESCPLSEFASVLVPHTTLFVCFHEMYWRKVCGSEQIWKNVTIFWILSPRLCSDAFQSSFFFQFSFF